MNPFWKPKKIDYKGKNIFVDFFKKISKIKFDFGDIGLFSQIRNFNILKKFRKNNVAAR